MQRLDTINNTQRRGQILPPPTSLGSPVTPHILRIPHNATPCSTMLCGLVQHTVSYGILHAFLMVVSPAGDKIYGLYPMVRENSGLFSYRLKQ